MSEVEVLLSVDAGGVPPDAVVFPAADPEAITRRLHAVFAGLCALALIGCIMSGVGRELVALLALIAGIFVVLATPTDAEPDEPKKSTRLNSSHTLISYWSSDVCS